MKQMGITRYAVLIGLCETVMEPSFIEAFGAMLRAAANGRAAKLFSFACPVLYLI